MMRFLAFSRSPNADGDKGRDEGLGALQRWLMKQDISKTEQVSIIVRHYMGGAVFKRFLEFCNGEQIDARSLLAHVGQR